ncbi:3-deoxy-manno-octulosonate cytidylyltransferase [Sphingomonas qilianensis]|uniref:Manno-octulosonate cytidylyltransferase n=1 Tax=Sphingomonas qilianensis TaxID=1736690 RepID=A0ABU9XRD6_9SPHN
MSGPATPGVGIIIPARFASTRYPGKPLATLAGAGGVARTLIERSWRAASAVPGVDFVAVATDDTRIAQEVERFGGTAIMTPESCANGTERCAAAVAQMANPPEIVVNLQGDAPLTPAYVVTDLIARLRGDASAAMATPAVRCTPSLYRHLTDDQKAGRVGGTTVVADGQSRALYFSKRVLPYLPDDWPDDRACPAFLHLGVYAYRPAALAAYAAWPVCVLEQVEGLEQLRFLHYGAPVAIVECAAPDWDVVELNNPSDVPIVEAMLRQRGSD